MIRVIGGWQKCGTAVSYSSPDMQGACVNYCLGVWSVRVCVVYIVCLGVWSAVCVCVSVCVCGLSVCVCGVQCVSGCVVYSVSVCRSERVTPTSSRGAESVTVTQRAPGADESRQTAVVEMSDAELRRKTKSIVDEYLHLNDLKVHIISTLSVIYLVSAGLLSLVCVWSVSVSVCGLQCVCVCPSLMNIYT